MTDLSEFVPSEKAVETARKLLVGKVADLIERSGIDVDNAILRDGIKIYQQAQKGDDGEPVVVDLYSISLAPSWEGGPEWPVVQPSKPVVVKVPTRKGVTPFDTGFLRCVILPDMQIGYYVGAGGDLVPTHDEEAIDVALQIVADVCPDRVICLGDNLDLPEMSKYRLTSVFARTTQATIDRAGQLAAQLRAICGPNTQIQWLEGNHEFRMSSYIIDNAKAAFGLKKANAPDAWPVLSVPSLCRFDEEDIEYIPGYPANETWINNRLRVIHGTHVVSNGSTAHRYLAHERASVVYGHIHRREWAERTRTGYDGPQTILAMSPGCLARVDGAVPSTKGGFDLDGAPIPVVEDWQQGIAVFTYEEGEGQFFPEQVAIHSGRAIYHGRVYDSSAEAKDLMA